MRPSTCQHRREPVGAAISSSPASAFPPCTRQLRQHRHRDRCRERLARAATPGACDTRKVLRTTGHLNCWSVGLSGSPFLGAHTHPLVSSLNSFTIVFLLISLIIIIISLVVLCLQTREACANLGNDACKTPQESAAWGEGRGACWSARMTCACVCMRVRACACVRARACVCACVCMRACWQASVRACGQGMQMRALPARVRVGLVLSTMDACTHVLVCERVLVCEHKAERARGRQTGIQKSGRKK